jgi:hypothetical protein
MKNRSGSYKTVLISEDLLIENRQIISTQIKSIKNYYAEKKLTPQEFTTLFIFIFLKILHQKNYLQKHSKSILNSSRSILEIAPPEIQFTNWEKEKLQGINCKDLFLHFNLKSIPKSIHRTIINWINHKWNLALLFHIPTPFELLEFEANNQRVITAICDEKKCSSLIFNKRDPLSFVLHDLMHADQFFNNPISVNGQLGFYKKIFSNYHFNPLQKLLREDKKFKDEFDYVVSDMNAYVIHLLKCFKSAFTRAGADDILMGLCQKMGMNQEQLLAMENLNMNSFSTESEKILCLFFENTPELINE